MTTQVSTDLITDLAVTTGKIANTAVTVNYDHSLRGAS